MHHAQRIIAVALAALVLDGCASDTAVAPRQDDAARAVTLFAQLADSVVRAHGDSAISTAYSSLAEAVRQGGRVSPIVITVDGVPTKFLATALQTEVSNLPCPGTPSCPVIARVFTLRSLVAWQQDDPRRIVQLSSKNDADPIRAYLFPVLVPFPGPSASLTFFDGRGGTFFGTSGTQKFAITKSEASCSPTSGEVVIAIYPAPPRCTKADFTVAFDAKAEPSTFLASHNTATGSHTFAMSAQAVLGARLELAAGYPPRPPIDLPPTVALPASLTVTTDSLVNLTLTITNPGAAPVQVVHPSSQRFDFVILDASTGLPVWRWSEGLGFFQALTTDTIAANGTLTYSASWKPAKKGSYLATGELVSLSHRAAAKASFTTP